MNPTYYIFECGCRIDKDKVIRVATRNKNGNTSTTVRCPKHREARIIKKERDCENIGCDKIVTQTKVNNKVAHMCPECSELFRLAKARAASMKRYRKVQAAKGLAVISKEERAKKVKPKKDVFRPPVAARSLTQAIIKRVRCIPCEGLFEVNQMIGNGL